MKIADTIVNEPGMSSGRFNQPARMINRSAPITTPLHRLTDAAEAIAPDKQMERVHTDRLGQEWWKVGTTKGGARIPALIECGYIAFNDQ